MRITKKQLQRIILHLNSEDAKNLGETLVEFSEYLFVASKETLYAQGPV
tara:strand:+ start:624 stop:770 length:147 start_codon:yes stop_codon:yes gene_type:complete